MFSFPSTRDFSYIAFVWSPIHYLLIQRSTGVELDQIKRSREVMQSPKLGAITELSGDVD